MLNFEYKNRTHLVYGKDTQGRVGELVKKYGGTKVLLHYGGGSIKRSGLYDTVVAALKEEQIDFVELGGVKPNPRVELVREAVKICKEEKVDFILAVGGGSVIDSAKATALGAKYDGDVWDFYKGGLKAKDALTLATILTLPATGSESSYNSVITNEAEGRKLGYADDLIRPIFSIVNPEMFFTLPKDQIANGVCDMMSHIFERYFTNTLHTDLIDGLCEATLKTVIKNAPKLMENPCNYDAWFEVGYAGTIAHNNLLGIGREQDWASHKLEHELSAIYDVAHGAGLSVITPAWMKYVYKENIGMFVQFAVNVMGVEMSFREPEAICLEGIRRLTEFFRSLGLPVTLSELGVPHENYELMAKKACRIVDGKPVKLGGLKKLDWPDCVEIYKLAENA